MLQLTTLHTAPGVTRLIVSGLRLHLGKDCLGPDCTGWHRLSKDAWVLGSLNREAGLYAQVRVISAAEVQACKHRGAYLITGAHLWTSGWSCCRHVKHMWTLLLPCKSMTCCITGS